jgi:vanillate O-demethylase monooxygenase subunit
MKFSNRWYCVARASEVSTQPMEQVICDRPIVLFRTAETGKLVALENRCPHRQAPLSMGKVIGDDIMCIYHGWIMDATGQCVYIPGQDNVASSVRVGSYPVVVKWGMIWLWIGDADKVDEGLIPKMDWTEDDEQSSVFIRFYVKADYQLMADNLLDLSHSDFLHASSFGSQAGQRAETDHIKAELETWADEDAVNSVRTLRNVILSPMAAAWASTDQPVTRTHRTRWTPPNNINIELIIENDENKVTIHHDHIMTPETGQSCHYFMIWTRDFAVHSGYPSDEDVRREQTSVIGAEDIPIVEAQQRNRIRFNDPADIPGVGDKFLGAVHRRIAELEKEAKQKSAA